MSMSEVERLLRHEGTPWKVSVIEGDRLVEAVPYEHLGIRGDLWLRFHHDKLMHVQFFPKDIDRYLKALSEEDKATPPLSPNVERIIRQNRIIWKDRRLADEAVRRDMKRL